MVRNSATDFLSTLGAPARRALEREGITSLTKLSRYSEKEVLHLHGMGPSTIPKLKEALRENGLTFKKA
jgi:DNA-directed RNA polymerase alpha subunit